MLRQSLLVVLGRRFQVDNLAEENESCIFTGLRLRHVIDKSLDTEAASDELFAEAAISLATEAPAENPI